MKAKYRKPLAGVPETLYATPLYMDIKKFNLMELHYLAPEQITQKLLSGEVEIGLMPSLEYAQGKGNFIIIPDVAVSHETKVASALLFFKGGENRLKKIAIPEEVSLTYRALLGILLLERYQIEPQIINLPAGHSPEFYLQHADAVLLTDSLAAKYLSTSDKFIDLIEEWIDLTDLPFVEYIWVGHQMFLSGLEVRIIQQAAKKADSYFPEVTERFAHSWQVKQDSLLEQLNSVKFSFSQKEREGLEEFYNFAFYFGLIEHIPELHFFGETKEEEKN